MTQQKLKIIASLALTNDDSLPLIIIIFNLDVNERNESKEKENENIKTMKNLLNNSNYAVLEIEIVRLN